MIVRPSSMQPATSAAISASVSGSSTTNGYSTRQSVASVTCETRCRPSKRMLSLAVTRPSSAQRAPAQRRDRLELLGEGLHRGRRGLEQAADRAIALGVGVRRAPLLDLVEAMVQRVDQLPAPARVVEQVVLQIGIALDDPDVAEHLVEHARRAPGLALVAQPVQGVPGRRAEQPDHDLAIGERGVVVRDLAQPRRVRAARRRAGRSGSGAAGHS